ncbi:carboxylate-amine ligase [Streptomyces sp. SudanB182_2057]|uniref:carboxylate-amine ligase n=1 Tax=Streptomyces sp. SudanB182_2057 TaxID=3035281 RepID=UPI003F577ABD
MPEPYESAVYATADRTFPARAPGGTGPPVPTLGVEEEFVLADRRTRAAVRKASAVVLAARHRMGEDHVAPEMAQAQVESISAVCRTGEELRREVARLRGGAAAVAAEQGCVLVASGSPVLGDPGPPPILDKARYHRIESRFGALVRHQCVNACHVHVGVTDRELAVRVVDHLRCWMPLLLALTANSPFFDGDDTGYASWRSMVWSRWPAAGPPPLLGSAARYETLVGRVVDSGAALDPAMLYWHVRPSRHVPTVEVRIADVLPEAADTVAYALLVRALVAHALSLVREGAPASDVPDMVLRAACWRAARYGTAGTLPATQAPDCPSLPVLRQTDDLWALVEPYLSRCGDDAPVGEWFDRVRRSGNGAMRQRRIAERHAGRLEAVVDDLAVPAT